MERGENDQLTDHEFDGIREYDNPTPGWWHFLFIGSVVFAVLYTIFWHFSPLSWTIQEAWEADKSYWLDRAYGQFGELTGDEETILEMMSNEDGLQLGRAVFEATCVSCHNKDGGGNIGPNLTDDYYLNVKTLEDIYTTVSEGVTEKGMPSHKHLLVPNQIVLVSAYVASLRGKDIDRGRAPQGELIDPWPAADGSETGDEVTTNRTG